MPGVGEVITCGEGEDAVEVTPAFTTIEACQAELVFTPDCAATTAQLEICLTDLFGDFCADNSPASCEPVFVCTDGPQFMCEDGESIPEDWRCDGEADCADESDEPDDCPMFMCADGGMIAEAWQCDGEPDCADASDEGEACPTFMCTDGETIPEDWRCDGEADCADESDEAGCPQP